MGALDIAKAMYASMRRQDIESLLSLLADDVMIHGPTSSTRILPWGGSYRGKEGARQFFRLLQDALDVEQLDIIDFIAEREKVVVLGHISGKTNTVHKPFQTHFAHVLRTDLKREKIVEFRIFNDSALLAQAMV